MIMTCSEWWAYEVLIIFAGWISVRDQATYVILSNVAGQMFQIPKGLGDAACVLIGNSVGGGDAKLAKKYFRMTRVVTLTVVAAIALLVVM